MGTPMENLKTLGVRNTRERKAWIDEHLPEIKVYLQTHNLTETQKYFQIGKRAMRRRGLTAEAIRRESLGSFIKARRIAKGFSEGELADLIGVTTGYISKIEANKRRIPGPLLIALARELDFGLKEISHFFITPKSERLEQQISRLELRLENLNIRISGVLKELKSEPSSANLLFYRRLLECLIERNKGKLGKALRKERQH